MPATFRRRWLVPALLAFGLAEAAACPTCSYQRMLDQSWHLKLFAVTVLPALLLTCTRLDWVRVAYTFLGFGVLQVKLNEFLFLAGHPAVRPQHVMGAAIEPALWFVGGGLLGAGLLFCLGLVPFFRKNRDQGLRPWHPFLYLAVFNMARFVLAV